MLIVGVVLIVRRAVLQPLPAVYVQAFFSRQRVSVLVSVDHPTAGLATVIFYTYPAVVALMAVFALHERLTFRTVAALVLAMVGTCSSGVLAPQELAAFGVGHRAGGGGVDRVAIYMIIAEDYREGTSSHAHAHHERGDSASVHRTVPRRSCRRFWAWSPLQWGMSWRSRFCARCCPCSCQAIKRIGSTKASLISILETPFSLLLAFAVLGETLTACRRRLPSGGGSIVVTTLPSRAAKADGGGSGGAQGSALIGAAAIAAKTGIIQM